MREPLGVLVEMALVNATAIGGADRAARTVAGEARCDRGWCTTRRLTRRAAALEAVIMAWNKLL